MTDKLKDIYIASSIGELNKFAEIGATWRNKGAKMLCNTAAKVFDEAKLSKLAGDQERSYTLFMKFLNLFSYIKKSEEYRKDKAFFDKLIGSKKIVQAIEEAEEIQKSLIKRYTLLEEEREAVKLLKDIDLKTTVTPAKVSSFSFPTTTNGLDSVIKPSISEPLTDFISSNELYFMLQQRSLAVLIMDVRKLDNFEVSRVKHDCCINIPAEVLQPGLTASQLEKLLPRRSKEWWPRRLTADRIILVDWFGKAEPSVSIEILKTVMTKWDPLKSYRGHIQILEQGYEDWLLRYPMSTTNSMVDVPIRHMHAKTDLSNGISVNFSYPDLDETLDYLAAEKSEETVIDVVDLSRNQPLPNPTPVSTRPAVNRSVKPTTKSSKLNSKLDDMKDAPGTPFPYKNSTPDPQTAISPRVSSIPVIDRQAKAQALARFNSQLDKDLELSRKQRDLEQEWAKVRAKQTAEAEESMRIILQEREEVLLKKLDEFAKQDEEQQRLIQELRLQLEQQRMKEVSIPKLDDEQRKTEEEDKALREKEEMKRKLADEVERLRTERKRKQDEAKRLQEQQQAAKPIVEPKESPSPAIAKPQRPITLDRKGLSHIPLKGDETSPLSPPGRLNRSRSFHNISERSVAKKQDSSSTPIARVNRGLKPRNDVARPQPKFREFNPTWGSVEHGLTGLRNLGNTCYMNSILQCLSHTATFSAYFLKELHLNEINIQNSTCKGTMAEEIAAVISVMWAGHYRSIACRDFKAVVGNFNEPFRGTDQQDAHEFLTVLLDWISEDLNKSRTKGPLPPLPEDVDDGGKLAWEQYKMLHDSIIEHLFVGQQRSILVCRACGKDSVSYEPFNCLSVPLPQKGSKCTLNECLQLYLQGEVISGWTCPKCKGKKEAVKKFDLWKLPPYLIIHLKRFYQDTFLRNYANKRQTHVDFPLRNLDLEDANGMHRYKLYAVSNHYGSMDSGHYTAICLAGPNSQWYRFDDQELSQVDAGQVRTPAAYILFYQRVEGKV